MSRLWRCVFTIDELLQLLDEQRGRIARFVPAALHVHSPGSHDWGKSGDVHANDRQRLLSDAGVTEYLDALAASVSIVCITDHMKTAHACRLASAARDRSDITVLPGMEVNVVLEGFGNARLHLLTIFPENHDVTQIDRIFAGAGGVPAEAERTGQEEVKLRDLQPFVEAVHREGGMVIFAHVDERGRGVRARFRAMRDETLEVLVTGPGDKEIARQQISNEYGGYLARIGPDAVEIMNPADRVHYVSYTTPDGKPARVPCVIRSDHHAVEMFASPDKTTWLKVAQPDFDGVRGALDFFETRVRFVDDLPATPYPRIVGLRLRSPTGEGLFDDLPLAFSPNLNCLIGPRGSGKSTVLEALRYTLGQNSGLVGVADLESPLDYGELALGIQQANLADTVIEVIYLDARDDRHTVVAAYDAQTDDVAELVEARGHRRRVTPSELRAAFPLRVFSWSELETLGRKPELQRAVVDRLVADMPALTSAREGAYRDLAANRERVSASCARLRDLLEADNRLLRRFRQYRDEFALVNTDEVAGLFAGLDQARARRDLLEAARDRLGDIAARLETATPTLAIDATDDLDPDVLAWWREVERKIGLGTAAAEVTRLLGQAASAVAERRQAVDELLQDQRAEVERIEQELRAQVGDDATEELRVSQRETRKERLDRASRRRQEYLEERETLDALLAERRKLVTAAEAALRSVTAAREQARDELVAPLVEVVADLDVEINVEESADRRHVVEFMRDTNFLTPERFGQYKRRRVAERASAMAPPLEFALALLNGDASQLAKDRSFGDDTGLTTYEAEQFVEQFSWQTFDEASDISLVKPELLEILRLQEQRVDDRVTILLDGRPVDERSPGQRASAMLPLVALSENTPLIIDQPEDNLDNRMVGGTLTRILAELKERRQLIVTTHNPNIVVGGDAEQVAVLRAVGAHAAELETTGSIDHEDIVSAVVGLMEGGADAFRLRSRRYHLEP